MRISAKGFTIVELLIIISVIGILAGIGAVSYTAWRDRAAIAAVKSDLHGVAAAMKNELNFNNEHPNSSEELVKIFTPSDKVTMSLQLPAANQPVYSGLTPVQNGVLFHDICRQLVSEGFGIGIDNGGNPNKYIGSGGVGCNVYNHNQLQVNDAWSGPSFNTPVSATALTSHAASLNYSDPWHLNRTTVEREFYETWHARFESSGGNYPVTSFWDNWASPGNGVMKPSLPEPTTPVSTDDHEYCVQAEAKDDSSKVMHVTGIASEPKDGACPV